MIANKSKEVMATVVILCCSAFLVLCSVVLDSNDIDIIYFLVLILAIVKYLSLCRK